MQALKQFSLPIQGMKIGFHNYTFQLDKSFFSEFENSMFQDGNLSAELNVEKKSDHLVVDLTFSGTVDTECNRCTDDIAYPIEEQYDLLIKYDEVPREEDEIIYLSPESPEFNCAKILYDLVTLSVPIQRTCDEVDNKSCNAEILDRLYNQDLTEDNQAEEEDNPFSEALKNLKLN
jgi:uncharacterized metal-binding protein YceD (DUF177 family)